MRSTFSLLFSLALAVSFGQSTTITGFTSASVEEQLAAEAKFDSFLKADNLKQWMKRLSARPHHLGSAYDKQNAEFIRDLFTGWGYDTRIETYQVLFPTPKVRLLELIAPAKFKAKLHEPSLKEDATSGQVREQLPTYNAYSADGDVTGELVFVNYGVPEDYKALKRMGIDVKGKIVIAKYGQSWRGIKPKVAQEHGAIGCLIYSDPSGDGYTQGDTYPTGSFKGKDGVQRGSVMDMPNYPGDPLTPGIGATKNADRINREDATNLLKIPVQPISYADAQPLLAALSGPVAPPGWSGTLPITYHVGPGAARVHLKLEFEWKLVDCHNVIATLTGSEWPDEWVIRGNHHDAWVNGATDPVSGMVSVLEEARAVSELVKTGWRPKRTLVYCAWDGEEQGLIGSTEWVEDHAGELVEKAVVYVNTDGNERGFIFAAGSHTLEPLMDEISKEILDPQTGISVLERSRSQQIVNAANTEARRKIVDKMSLTLDALGSGSDYSPFIQHLGVPSLNLGFSGEGSGGEYHSIYDSFDHYVRFKDPTFEYGVVLVKVAGRATLRMANAEVLPFDFRSFYNTLRDYVDNVSKLLDDMREATRVENQMIREKRFTYAADPTKTYVAPDPKVEVPFLNFSGLNNAMADLETATKQFAELRAGNTKPNTNLTTLNKMLFQAEQKLIVNEGLPLRPWFRHTIYAPGLYTGYGVKTLPGIREAIEERRWTEAQEQIGIVSKAIGDYTAVVSAASKMLMMR